ncbi:signal protein [Actinomadura bangladeshensis]|uniref:signal protein n=1 Tax=Actinomadura bangladeshensis TaxID=453573 RepID=UPI001A9CE6B8|nr:signal protein [Actinomadura bangladeshensis]
MIRGRIVVSLLLLGLVAGCAEENPDGAGASAEADAVTESGPPSPSGGVAVGSQEPADVQSAWWSWAAGSPSGRNPVEDTTGEFCAVDQPSDLWFLAGTFGGSVTRGCDIPAGRTLVAPVVNQRGPEEDCAAFMETATGTLTVDGKQAALKRWSAVPITITGVPGNPASEEGSVRAYGCGLWGVLPPLPPGPHKVEIRGSSGDFRTSATYNLTVTP